MNIDPTSSTRIWANLLTQAGIVFGRVGSADRLNQLSVGSVLILPSVVFLTDTEKQAVTAWRERGGSVLSTWKVGTHSQDGKFKDFEFMRTALDVRVDGDTDGRLDQNFMVLHGDNPVLHSLDPGLRIWMERVPNQLPLRISGQQKAAQILDWSRNVYAREVTGMIAYGERVTPAGKSSRAVHLGFAEQNWQRSDPQQLSALANDIIAWLLRRPKAYLGHWPHPFTSATVVALKVANPLSAGDMAFADTLRSFGGRLTAYLLSGNAAASQASARQLQTDAHELGYFGDQFESFGKQSAVQQVARIDKMRREMREAGIEITEPSSFAAPSDGYDQTTLALLMQRGFGNFLATADASESRVPMVWTRGGPAAPTTTPSVTATWIALPGVAPSSSAQTQPSSVVLPVTLINPEAAIEVDSKAGIENFSVAHQLSHRSAALSVIRIPSQTLLMPQQRKQILDQIGALRTQTWIATATQVSEWWRARTQIQVSQTVQDAGLLVTLKVGRPIAGQEAFSVFVNLPTPLQRVRLEVLEGAGAPPSIVGTTVDRVALVWRQPTAGTHRWRVIFEPPP